MDEKFKEILNQVNPEILNKLDVDLVEEGVLDSFSIMRVVTKLESVYDCYITPENIIQKNFESAEAIWKMLERSIK